MYITTRGDPFIHGYSILFIDLNSFDKPTLVAMSDLSRPSAASDQTRLMKRLLNGLMNKENRNKYKSKYIDYTMNESIKFDSVCVS